MIFDNRFLITTNKGRRLAFVRNIEVKFDPPYKCEIAIHGYPMIFRENERVLTVKYQDYIDTIDIQFRTGHTFQPIIRRKLETRMVDAGSGL